MTTTRVERHIRASRERVYAVLVDPDAVPRWKVPDEMRADVHAFEAREGGAIRVTLTYDGDGEGKTDAHSDTYSGCFVTLVPGERIVDRIAFETGDPSMRGTMTTTITLADAAGGTLVTAVHEGVPPGVSPADNELGWRMALDRLAGLVETAPVHEGAIAVSVDAEHGLIHTVAAVITRDDGRVLLVRKRGTCIFIQPGGKREPGEASLATLSRELDEELGVTFDAARARHLGTFEDAAVHEPGRRVRAEAWIVEVLGEPHTGAEIEALAWVDPVAHDDADIAPLSARHILPAFVATRG